MASIITYNGSWLGYNGSVVTTRPDPNPLGLPAYTMRFQFDNASYDPSSVNTFPAGSTWTRVSSSPNVWDFTYQTADWSNAFLYIDNDNHHVGQFKSETSGNTVVLGANTTNVSSMYRMFEDCGSLNSLALFDTSSVTNMEYMFVSCSALSSVNLFDTSSVTSMLYMFGGCTALTTVPLFNTSLVRHMHYMFRQCTSLISVPLFNTSSVTRMTRMFDGCSSLTSVPLFNTSSVTDMSHTFDGCSSLTNVPLFNTSSVTSMEYMCYGCRSLSSIPLFNTSSVTDMNHAFENCYVVKSGALALYQQASSQSTIQYHTGTFKNCGNHTTSGAEELAQIPSSWK